MIKFLKRIIKIKIKFKKPTKADVLVYDIYSLPNAKILFDKYKISTMAVRLEEINLFILIKSLVGNPFKLKESYLKNYVKIVSPKIIYSAIDNNPALYKLKSIIKNVKIVADQKAMRDPFFFNLLKETKHDLSCDAYFVFSEYEKQFLSKYIKTNFFLSGPTYNNTLPTLDKFNFEKVIFISGKLRTPNTNEYDYEKKVFLNLIKYCKKNSLELYFKEKNGFYDFKFNINSQSNSKKREIFFKNYFENNNWNFIPWDLDKNSLNYKKIFNNVLIIFTDSTLGYEFLSRGYKCVSFTDKFPIYGLDHNFKKKGLFWSNSTELNEMIALIDSVKMIDSYDWKKSYKEYSKKILPYDKENKFKKSVIRNFFK